MPPTAQRLRDPAAFVLLAFGAISTFFFSISFLFGPGDSNTTFSSRALTGAQELLNPIVAFILLGAVYLAHFGTQMKAAKTICLTALVSVGVSALFGLIAVFASFGTDGVSGWDKTVIFFVGAGALGIYGVAGMLILGYYQQHAPARPAAPAAPVGFPPQQQWGQPQPPQVPQQQWQPQPPQNVPPQQQWGQPQPPQPPQQQWGTPAPQPPQVPQQQPPQPPQQGYPGGGTDSMMTQAIPTQQSQVPPPDGGPFSVGNWTSE